jgi:hypothetical protein
VVEVKGGRGERLALTVVPGDNHWARGTVIEADAQLSCPVTVPVPACRSGEGSPGSVGRGGQPDTAPLRRLRDGRSICRWHCKQEASLPTERLVLCWAASKVSIDQRGGYLGAVKAGWTCVALLAIYSCQTQKEGMNPDEKKRDGAA